MPTIEYSRFVLRVWDRLELATGRTPLYIDRSSIATHCPACLDGTLRIRFIEHPRPGMVVSSKAGGPGHCSDGCDERLIAEVLA